MMLLQHWILILQDVASTALLNQLRKHDAHHGCAVLMEVATGDIKAIANLETRKRWRLS